MLAFAHIPTGTTANKGFDTDEAKGRIIAPASVLIAIGADIETGGATLRHGSGCLKTGVHLKRPRWCSTSITRADSHSMPA